MKRREDDEVEDAKNDQWRQVEEAETTTRGGAAAAVEN
jgi:hypothetical protein